MTTDDNHLDKYELADRLGVSWRTVAAYARSGVFPHVRAGKPGSTNRQVLFTPDQAAECERIYYEARPREVAG